MLYIARIRRKHVNCENISTLIALLDLAKLRQEIGILVNVYAMAAPSNYQALKKCTQYLYRFFIDVIAWYSQSKTTTRMRWNKALLKNRV